ncbi:hypothetical protein ACFWU5_13190 [Nocardia sp. NPDC058640]|uniref:hypothetical protein n=1 Tax=Nocardia sp. NPDC058640 TaxID=3346571 RepID=UPI0036601336
MSSTVRVDNHCRTDFTNGFLPSAASSGVRVDNCCRTDFANRFPASTASSVVRVDNRCRPDFVGWRVWSIVRARREVPGPEH